MRKPRTRYQQIASAVSFEKELNAKLIRVFRKYNKVHFTFQHNDTKKKWTTTLSKLENYGHNKFKGNKVKAKKNTLKTKEEVIYAFKEVHGDTYDYTNINYVNSNTKVSIGCNIHGDFMQLPRMHKSGQGCPRCAKEFDGWSYTAWKAKGETSKHFDSFKVYIIKCYGNKETFYKIGKTFNTLHKRFTEKDRIPYKYEVVKVYSGESFDMSRLEVKLQNLNKDTRYIPKIKFDGSFECFSNLKEETFAY